MGSWKSAHLITMYFLSYHAALCIKARKSELILETHYDHNIIERIIHNIINKQYVKVKKIFILHF